MKKNSFGQGTIEYLVIIGVVIVIALIVVGLLTSFLDSGSQIDETTSKIYWQSQPLAIIDSINDEQGNLIIVLKNNTSERNIINSITINSMTVYPENFSIMMGETKTIYLNKTDLQATNNNQITINYTTQKGLQKTQTGNTNLHTEQIQTITPNENTIKLIKDNCFDWNSLLTQHPICTCDDLNTIDFNSTTLGWTYELQNNLDFKNCDSSYTTGEGWKPIGASEDTFRFTGDFDGQNHTIKNLYIYRPLTDWVGLFGFAYTTKISNLGLIDQNITGQNNVGGLLGESFYGNNEIENSYTTGVTKGTGDKIGGLIGISYSGKVVNSYSSGIISGASQVGGIIGYAYSTDVNDSYNSGTINGTNHTGGITGNLGTVNNSYNNGTINGTERTGGIIGVGGTINNSYNTGTINGTAYTGGIIGVGGTVNNSYNNGTINGTDHTGGIIGMYGTINNSYNIGTITGSIYYAGGINGSWGTVNNSYNIGTINGNFGTGGIMGGWGIVNTSHNSGTINGTEHTGGIIGYLGTINNSYNTGTINGSSKTGGINGTGGTVNNSYNMGTINGSWRIGGLNGSHGTINNSYNTGTVLGTSEVGGIIGYHADTKSTINSFSTGSIIRKSGSATTFYGTIGETHAGATVTNLYWFDSNSLDNATGCYHGGDANCTYLNDTNYTQLFNSSTAIYTTAPAWDGNWIWSGSNYPKLSWE